MESESIASPSALLASSNGTLWDTLLVALIMLAALVYLYRKLWTKRGACSDCTSGGGGCPSCQISKIEFDTSPLEKH